MNEKSTLSSKIERSNHIIEAEIDGEIIMMSTENGQHYGLDKVSIRGSSC